MCIWVTLLYLHFLKGDHFRAMSVEEVIEALNEKAGNL